MTECDDHHNDKSSKDIPRDRYIEAMRSFMDIQDKPQVGIFWYHRDEKALFGVTKLYALELPFDHTAIRTCRRTHRALWENEQRKKKALFQGNYAQTPRGRIVEIKDVGFRLIVGHWINEPWADKVVELVKFEFNLDHVNLETWAINLDLLNFI